MRKRRRSVTGSGKITETNRKHTDMNTKKTAQKLTGSLPVRCTGMVRRMRALAKSMIENAKALRSGKGYRHPELQSERNASAHSMEFWAGKILREISPKDEGTERRLVISPRK